MSEQHTINARWISSIVVLALLVVVSIASAFIYWTGNWEEHRWGLTLTLRILWGVWSVIALVTIFTRVTIFGWSFRRYVRWAENNMPSWTRFRPTKAPWSKSGVVSFSFTLTMVLLFCAAAISTAVMWILTDVTGEWVFWLVFKIVWSSWWVLTIGVVLARVAVFGVQRQRELRRQQQPEHSLAGSQHAESDS